MIPSSTHNALLSQHQNKTLHGVEGGNLQSAEVEQIEDSPMSSRSHNLDGKYQIAHGLVEDINGDGLVINFAGVIDDHAEFEPDVSEYYQSIAVASTLAPAVASRINSEEFAAETFEALTDEAETYRNVVLKRIDSRHVKMRSQPRFQRKKTRRVESGRALSNRFSDHEQLLLLQERLCQQEIFSKELERRIDGNMRGTRIMVEPSPLVISSPLSHLLTPSILPTSKPDLVVANLSSKGSMRTFITESATYSQSQRNFPFSHETISHTTLSPSLLAFDSESSGKPENLASGSPISRKTIHHRDLDNWPPEPVFPVLHEDEMANNTYSYENEWQDGEVQADRKEFLLSGCTEDVSYILENRLKKHTLLDRYEHQCDYPSMSHIEVDRRSVPLEEASSNDVNILPRQQEAVASPISDERHIQIWNRFFSNAMKTEWSVEEGGVSTNHQDHLSRVDDVSSRGRTSRSGVDRHTSFRDIENDGDEEDIGAMSQDVPQEALAVHEAPSLHWDENNLGKAVNFSDTGERRLRAESSVEESTDLLLSAVLRCDLRAVEELLALGADPNHYTAHQLESLPYSHIAVRCGFEFSEYGAERVDYNEDKEKGAQCLALLAEYGADLDAVDARGQSALHVAAGIGNYAALEYLLESAVNSRLEDSRGNSALHLASKGKHIKCRDFLLTYVTSPHPSCTPSLFPHTSSAIINANDNTSYEPSREKIAEDDVIQISMPTVGKRNSSLLGVTATRKSYDIASPAAFASASAQSTAGVGLSISRDLSQRHELSCGVRKRHSLTEASGKSSAIVQEGPANIMRQTPSSRVGAARDRLNEAMSSVHGRQPTISGVSTSKKSTFSGEQGTNRRRHRSIGRGTLSKPSASLQPHQDSSGSDSTGRAAQQYRYRDSSLDNSPLTPRRPSSKSGHKLPDRSIDAPTRCSHLDARGPPISLKQSQSGEESRRKSTRSPIRKSSHDSVEDTCNMFVSDTDNDHSQQRYNGAQAINRSDTESESHRRYEGTEGSKSYSVSSANFVSAAVQPLPPKYHRNSRNKNEEEEVKAEEGDTSADPDRVSQAVWYVASSLITFAHSMLFTTAPLAHTMDQYEGLDDRQYSNRRISNGSTGWWPRRTATSSSVYQHSAVYQQNGLSVTWDKHEGEIEGEIRGPPTDTHLKSRGLGFDFNSTSTPPPLVAQDILAATPRGGVITGDRLRPPSEVSVAIAAAAGRHLSVHGSAQDSSGRRASSSWSQPRYGTSLDLDSEQYGSNDISCRISDVSPDLTLHDAVSPERSTQDCLSPLATNGYSMGSMPVGVSWRYVDVLQSQSLVLDKSGA